MIKNQWYAILPPKSIVKKEIVAIKSLSLVLELY